MLSFVLVFIAVGTIPGRYAHASTVVNNNLLVVIGGFRGNVLSDFKAVSLPEWLVCVCIH